MTDITELAQALKAAAENATPWHWEYNPGNTSIEYNVDSMDEDQGSIVYVDSGDFTQAQTDRNGKFIALANPANVTALVEALEKAQTGEKQWREVVDAFCADDADWHKLTNSTNALISLLSQALCKQADRIAELESLTVKLPERYACEVGYNAPDPNGDMLDRDDVIAVLTAAGIKVETE